MTLIAAQSEARLLQIVGDTGDDFASRHRFSGRTRRSSVEETLTARVERRRIAAIIWWRVVHGIGACLLGLTCAAAFAGSATVQDAAALHARHAALRAQLADSPFQRPLHLESSETSSQMKGDVHAVLAQPYGELARVLQGMEHWCDILILHLNVKYCRGSSSGGIDTLTVMIGRKFDQPLADAHRVDFAYTVVGANVGYFRVLLNAESGPLDTKRYRIMLEAVPLDANHTFLHLSYSYVYGIAGRLAMLGYLATLGRDKVGFTIVGRRNGQPVYVDGMRGVVERNAMRYYLAVEAYLGALALPPLQQLERRLQNWYAATERYHLQLHELGREEYLAMKRKEAKRQQTGVGSPISG